MFIEVRKDDTKKKYYLSHSYRINGKVKKIVRYIGLNLRPEELERLRKEAEKSILEKIKERNILEFELTKEEIEDYQRYDFEIEVYHLQKLDWKRFTESFTYNTNAIEGSTVHLPEVRDLLGHREKPHNADELESLNVAKAVQFIKKSKGKISVDLIKKIHFICFQGTKPFTGELRKVEVVIKDGQGKIIHRGAQAKKVKALLEELCRWYEKHKNKYPPLLLAALVHNQFEKIHPFQDGNGRVGRLLLNYVLLQHHYPPLNVYLKDRNNYYLCLQKFDSKNDVKSTLKFLISQYKKQYR